MAFEKEFILLDNTQHDVKSFSCGKPFMDEFLTRHAARQMKMGISSSWVLPVIEEPKPQKAQIASYYSLTLSTVRKEEIPYGKSLPGYPIPAVLLARLAVQKKYARQGLGEKTLITALRKAVEVTDQGLPALGVILDVLDQDALTFYQHYEMFEPFSDDPMRLFVSMHALKHL